MERLAAGQRTRRQCSTANRIFLVCEGSGETAVGDRRFKLAPRGDTVVVPTWNKYCEHVAETDARLFCLSDEPLMRFSNYYRFRSRLIEVATKMDSTLQRLPLTEGSEGSNGSAVVDDIAEAGGRLSGGWRQKSRASLGRLSTGRRGDARCLLRLLQSPWSRHAEICLDHARIGPLPAGPESATAPGLEHVGPIADFQAEPRHLLDQQNCQAASLAA